MAGSVGGYVVHAHSTEPLEGAEVFVVGGAGPSPDIAPLTDAAGWFAFDDLRAGDWLLGARGPDGGSGEATVRVFDNALTEVTIEVTDVPHVPRRSHGGRGKRAHRPNDQPGDAHLVGSARGRVLRGQNGRPVTDATITIVRGAGPAPDIGPMTDRAGRFVLDGLVEGEWVLRAHAPDGAVGEGTVHVSAGHAAEVTIEVWGGSGRGTSGSR
jgi:hypothetical protein